jgi:hypothetical protein
VRHKEIRVQSLDKCYMAIFVWTPFLQHLIILLVVPDESKEASRQLDMYKQSKEEFKKCEHFNFQKEE